MADPPRRRANKRKGKGSYANDRPPILSLISRTSHDVRYWVLEHADKPSTRTIIEGNVPRGSTILYTDEASNYGGAHSQHATVCHSVKEWARDDDGDGKREVHCNSCEGAGTALRTFLRTFRGVHKYYLADYVATFETMANAKRITAAVVQRVCFGDRQHTKDSGAAGGAADLLTVARSLMQHWQAGRQRTRSIPRSIPAQAL